MKPSIPYLSLFFNLVLFSTSFPLVFSSDALYNNLLQCLTAQSNNNTTNTISNILYTKQNPQYSSVLTSYIRNLRFTYPTTPKPALIITPRTASDVSAAVVCCRKLALHVKIRSGGHDYEGLSYVSDDQFVILDMFNLRAVRVDPVKKTAYVEAGATLGELYYGIQEQSGTLAFPAGVCPTVGVGGHISGGGYGNMIRKHGLSVDHVVDAVVVDATGRVLDRAAMGEDMFWAIRGGGGASFGVVVSFTLALVDVPARVTVFNVKRVENATDLLYRWQFLMQKVDPNLFMRLLLQPVYDPVASKKQGQRVVVARVTFIGLYLGDLGTLLQVTNASFSELGLTAQDCLEVTWAQSVLFWNSYNTTSTPLELLLSRNYTADYLKRKSDYVTQPISKPALTLLLNKLVQIGKPGLVFNSYGGRMSQIPASATPFPHRAGNLFKVQYSIGWDDPGQADDDKYIGLIRELHTFMTPYVSKNPRGAYFNYRDLDIGETRNYTYAEGEVYGRKYFLGNFDRLVKVKTQVDPQNFFRNEQSIPVLKS